jgi:hypothetical protein
MKTSKRNYPEVDYEDYLQKPVFESVVDNLTRKPAMVIPENPFAKAS